MVLQCYINMVQSICFLSIRISNNKIRLYSKPLGYSLWSPVCDESFILNDFSRILRLPFTRLPLLDLLYFLT